MRIKPLGQNMVTRCSWILRCSILINVVIILYISSQVLISGGNKFISGSAFFLHEEEQQMEQQGSNIYNSLNKYDPLSNLFNETQFTATSPVALLASPPKADINHFDDSSAGLSMQLRKDIESVEFDSNLGDTADVIGNIVNKFNYNTDPYIVTGDEKDFGDRLRSILKCYDRPYKAETLQRGDFWVLQNYVRADHGELKCHESITYTTHADYTFLDNLIPLLERWNAPVSIAMHAPGTDFQPTLDSIRYLRDCLPESDLVRMYTTFHIYFSTKHIPENVPNQQDALKVGYNCTLPPPYFNITAGHLYKTQTKLLYPVNVGRNIARDAALTHFILASDIEFYPNPGLVKKFLEMIARNEAYLHRKAPRVFPLSIFEVEANSAVPRDKTELQELLRTAKAIPFHEHEYDSYHRMPKSNEWMVANETDGVSVFYVGKRTGHFVNWEPIYIGTQADPHYDERLSWEGKSDKMTQVYALCVLDYEFHILDNGFLVHKPGIKRTDGRRPWLTLKTNELVLNVIYPELNILYGTRKGCRIGS